MRKRGLKNPSIINRGYRPSKYHKDSSYPSIALTHTHTHIYSHSQRDWILCKNKLVHYNMWSAWELYRPQECFDMGLYTSAKNTAAVWCSPVTPMIGEVDWCIFVTGKLRRAWVVVHGLVHGAGWVGGGVAYLS